MCMRASVVCSRASSTLVAIARLERAPHAAFHQIMVPTNGSSDRGPPASRADQEVSGQLLSSVRPLPESPLKGILML